MLDGCLVAGGTRKQWKSARPAPASSLPLFLVSPGYPIYIVVRMPPAYSSITNTTYTSVPAMSTSVIPTLPPRAQAVIALVDAVNAEDPNMEVHPKTQEPIQKELLYSHRMSDMVEEYKAFSLRRIRESDSECKTAELEREEELLGSDLLHVVSRAQHVGRWKLKRSDFAEGRVGYLKVCMHVYTCVHVSVSCSVCVYLHISRRAKACIGACVRMCV